ncbi:hypothetical protein QBC47DRAFT_115865 [Echria macrotheca]|uniref:Steroid 5-alpha reductase C-terminal domain-containing protein n=1 Tax=Echria macrotheca TaxID=438768 RepID=A0AAJ0BM68_9PEZI|nr:hypothetical protein QBC47DRAFT_115865 [Echria macrotheca]
MTLLQHLLHLTNFKSPLLRTLVPSVSAVIAIQTAFAVPSIAAQSDRFYDFSGALTYVAVSALSLYLPVLRGKVLASGQTAAAYGNKAGGLGLGMGLGMGWNWRQVVLSGAVCLWAVRLGTYLFSRVLQEGKDSRFDKIKTSPSRYAVAYAVQAVWISVCALPVIAVNAVPAAAFAGMGLRVTDLLGLGLFVGGITIEAVADAQKARWLGEKRGKVHDEQFLTRGLWSKSRHPNYFGESTLWTGIATAAAGVLVSSPVRAALGLSPAAALAVCFASPAFVTFLLLRVSGVPLSEKKYDKRFGDNKEYLEWKRNTPKFFPKLF